MLETEEWAILRALASPGLPHTPVRTFKLTEIRTAVNKLRPTKSPGYELITSRVLQELPDVGLCAITQIFNNILKPGKPAGEVQSYRPISLLPVLSKLFEKLLITRIQPTLQDKQILPDHQFGFRQKHATTEQVHHIVSIIHDALESDQYCMAAFLDISQAFDKV